MTTSRNPFGVKVVKAASLDRQAYSEPRWQPFAVILNGSITVV